MAADILILADYISQPLVVIGLVWLGGGIQPYRRAPYQWMGYQR